jgi:metal-dependent amidase/aminoacylase/carboxypeptidase family protein
MNTDTPVTASPLAAAIETAAHAVLERVTAWRRDFHAHPGELSVAWVVVRAHFLILSILDAVEADNGARTIHLY